MDEMIAVLDRFVTGADNSNEAAARLKDLIAASFPEDPYAQQVVVELTRYRLGGGPGFYDFPEMRDRLIAARKYLTWAI